MAVVVVSSSGVKLKREDCKRTKHDSAFSEWKILVGPSDWEDHSLGKEGAERYRTRNLPNCSSCPGVYELGIVVWRPQSGRDVGKIDPNFITPVYIGQADNVRTRLQCYGREGAHLENGYSNGWLNDGEQVSVCKEPGLFTEIFKRGFSVVFRWAPMKSKREAEKTEAKLLDNFDYAWNKGSNGTRRHNDILEKLSQSSTTASRFHSIVKKLNRQKQVGVKINVPFLLENGSVIYDNPNSHDLLSRIFKFGRSCPRLASVRFDVNEGDASTCGVALGHGSVCIMPPVEGRKRCVEHKGMKVNASNPKLITSSSSICGFALLDGSPCMREAVQGNKRCEEHKGRRIGGSGSKIAIPEKQHYVHGPIFECTDCNDHEHLSSGTSRPGQQQSQDLSFTSGGNITICGVNLEDGTFCTRQPVVGRKRCEEHKGMRVGDKAPMPKLVQAEIPSVFDGSEIIHCNDKKYGNTNVNDKFSPTCGTILSDGHSLCSRKPADGNKRCWQHNATMPKLVQAEIPSVFDGSEIIHCNDKKYGNTNVNDKFSPTCRAILSDGRSLCSRKPAEGNKRCWQHNATMPKFVQAEIPSVFDGSEIIYCNDKKYGNTNVNDKFSPTCGAILRDGRSLCSRKPAEGNKRCWQHNASSGFSACNDWTNYGSSAQSVTYRSYAYEGLSSTCGATLIDGRSFCSRKPVEGNKRCWQHEGMKANTSSGFRNKNDRTHYGSSSQSVSYRSSEYGYEGSSSTCGALCRSGSYCSRAPAQGRRRCWQH